MVEECNSADTGVGPSIANGSQLLASINEDFVHTATITVKKDPLTIEAKRHTSPIRLYPIAQAEELFAIIRPLKVLIR